MKQNYLNIFQKSLQDPNVVELFQKMSVKFDDKQLVKVFGNINLFKS